jgi:phytoene dehydrogenase-like protein
MLTGMKNQYDVIVVGGGHNGLVAAGYLGSSRCP